MIQPRRLRPGHPIGIADEYSVHGYMRLQPEKIDLEVAIDSHRTPGMRREVAPDRRAHLVPVEKIECDQACDQEGPDDDAGPTPKAAPMEAEVAEIGQRP